MATTLNPERVQMKAELKAAITQPDRSVYETLRALLVSQLGYDGFRALQQEAFNELFGDDLPTRPMEETYAKLRETKIGDYVELPPPQPGCDWPPLFWNITAWDGEKFITIRRTFGDTYEVIAK